MQYELRRKCLSKFLCILKIKIVGLVMCVTSNMLAQVNFERLRTLPLNSDLDSIILTEIYDSLWVDYGQEENLSISAGYKVTPIDSAFKIYVFEGEGCGAYCNPFWEMFWAWQNMEENHLEIEEAEGIHENIDSIIKLAESYYLLFGYSHGRPRGIEGMGCKTVSLLRFDSTPKMIWHFESCTSNLASEDEWIYELDYDAKSKTVLYRFQWYEDQEEFRTYIEEGKWGFDGSTFIELEKSKTYKG